MWYETPQKDHSRNWEAGDEEQPINLKFPFFYVGLLKKSGINHSVRAALFSLTKQKDNFD
jgi:hypothetical protein